MSIKYTVVELRKICKSKGIRGYSKMKKDELIKVCLGEIKKTPIKKTSIKKTSIKKSKKSSLKKTAPLPKNIDKTELPSAYVPSKKIYTKEAPKSFWKKIDKMIKQVEKIENIIKKLDKLNPKDDEINDMKSFVKRNKEYSKKEKLLEKIKKDIGKSKYAIPKKYKIYS